VVKPVSLSGSRGVIRADDETEVLAAAREIRAFSPKSEGREASR
jgi:biotin carboxylase